MGETPAMLVTTREFLVGRNIISVKRMVFDDEIEFIDLVSVSDTRPIRVVPRD